MQSNQIKKGAEFPLPFLFCLSAVSRPPAVKKSSARSDWNDTEQVAGGQSGKKAAPSIPRVVLLEPKLFVQETACFPEETAVLFCGAGDTNLQGMTVIQCEHTHKTAAVDNVTFVTYGQSVRLCGGPGNKVLNILAITKADIELPHNDHPYCTKFNLSCIIGKIPTGPTRKIIHSLFIVCNCGFGRLIQVETQ